LRLGDSLGIMELGPQAYPWVAPKVRTIDSDGSLINTNLTLLAFIDQIQDDQLIKTIMSEMESLADDEKKNGGALMMTVDRKSQSAERARSTFGVQTLAALVILDPKTHKKYVTSQVAAGSVSSFLNGYISKTITPFVKSGPRPPSDCDPQHPFITVVVANSFQEVVLDPSTAVLFDLYADWCPPCKKLAPHMLRVAQVLISELKVPNFKVAKSDSDANDADTKYLPEEYIPVVKLFPKGNDKTPIECKARTDVEIVEFLHSNGVAFDLTRAKALLAECGKADSGAAKDSCESSSCESTSACPKE